MTIETSNEPKVKGLNSVMSVAASILADNPYFSVTQKVEIANAATHAADVREFWETLTDRKVI